MLRIAESEATVQEYQQSVHAPSTELDITDTGLRRSTRTRLQCKSTLPKTHTSEQTLKCRGVAAQRK